MSDFTQTMKDWRRMCKLYSANFKTCCDGCPLDDLVQGNRGAIYDEDFADVVDWEELEKRIDKWAEEHPEPQYPTWLEWLESIGVMEDATPTMGRLNRNLELFGIPIRSIPSEKIFEHIPADIAEKLGIEPNHFDGAGKKEG